MSLALPASNLYRGDSSITVSDRTDTQSHQDEKLSDSQGLGRGNAGGHAQSSDSKSVGVRTLLFKFMGPPGYVILGQMALQLFAWGFYAAIWWHGFIAVPSVRLFLNDTQLADSFKIVGWACTQVSTMLTGCSSYLFSCAVQQSVTLYLRGEGMSFATFLSGVKVAGRSSIFDPEQRKWVVISLVVVFFANQQTSGWNTLIRPEIFFHTSHVVGRELDLSTPLLQPMLQSGALDFCVYNSSNLVALSVGQAGSGYTALSSDVGFPTSLTLIDSAFNTSTAGILPLTYSDIDASPWFPNQTVLPRTLSVPFKSLKDTLSLTSSINQQGFTADVDCSFRQPDTTTPSLTVKITNGTGSVPDRIEMSSDCQSPHGPFAGPLNITKGDACSGEGEGYIYMIACSGSDGSYTLILLGAGLYSFIGTMQCTVAPKVTNVFVEYTYDAFSDTLNATTLPGGSPDVGGSAGVSAATTLYNMFSFSQAQSTNVVGDQLTAILTQVSTNSLTTVIEEYIRGVVEYSGTVFRACLSVHNGTFHDGVPANMTIGFQGKLNTQYFGWQFDGPTCWVLLPGTAIAIATIYVLVRAVTRHAGARSGKDFTFNPADPMHLVSAASAGGLEAYWSGTEVKDLKAVKNVHIKVGTLNEREPAFIVEDRSV